MMPDAPFGFDKPEDSPGFLLWQTTLTWQRTIKKILEPFAVSHAQFVLMALLLWLEQHHDETTQVALVNWSKLDKMTVSKSLKKLTAQGLVHRAEHSTDTRAKSVTLTEKGKNLVHTLVPKVEEMDATFFGALPRNDQQTLIQMLNQLVAGIS